MDFRFRLSLFDNYDDENLGIEWWHMKAQTETPNTAGMLPGWASFGCPEGKYDGIDDNVAEEGADEDGEHADDGNENRMLPGWATLAAL